METISCAAIILIAVCFGYIVSLGERFVRAIEGSPTREQFAHLNECMTTRMSDIKDEVRMVRDVINGIPTPEELSRPPAGMLPSGMYMPQSDSGISALVPLDKVKAITN